MKGMRLSVTSLCPGGLLVSLLLLGLGLSSRSPDQQEVAALPLVVVPLPTPKAERRANFHGQGQAASAGDAATSRLLEEIQAALDSSNPGDAAGVFTNQLPALVRLDPWAAARFAQRNESQSWHVDFMRALVENWADLNPGEAVRWVAQIEKPDEQDNMLSCLCFQVARSDSVRAIQIIEQQGADTDRRRMLLGSLAHEWAIQDMANAINWAAEYPAGATRDGLFTRIALAESKSSPWEAACLLVQQVPPGPAQQEAGMSILHEWALQDAVGAAAWAEEFPDGELRDRAIDEVTRIAAYVAGPLPEVPLLMRE
jgi:hypothetical protein